MQLHGERLTDHLSHPLPTPPLAHVPSTQRTSHPRPPEQS